MGPCCIRGSVQIHKSTVDPGKYENALISSDAQLAGATLIARQLLFQTRIQKAKTEDPSLAINLYAKARIDFFVAMVFTAVITGFLMGPVFVLYRCQSQSGMILATIMLGFTFSFAMLCQVCTTAKRHEIFAATAAYCAVLVVFISQNAGSNTPAKAP